MKAILVNYNFDPENWWDTYGIDARVYDRSDDGISRTFNAETYLTKNIGDVDYDKLSYLIENYDNLPDIFIWGKSNLFKYMSEEEFSKVAHNSAFTPLLTMNHRVYSDKFGQVNKYVGSAHGSIYAERADSWFFNAGLDRCGRFKDWYDWSHHFGLPQEAYIPFAPGGNYILTREAVHKHSRDLYAEMRNYLPYAMHPVEAHCCERSYFYLFR